MFYYIVMRSVGFYLKLLQVVNPEACELKIKSSSTLALNYLKIHEQNNLKEQTFICQRNIICYYNQRNNINQAKYGSP